MSGFDKNPFADPEINNPFADPSVTQVTQNAANTQKGLEDYNPFADQGSGRLSTQARGAANPPQYQSPVVQSNATNYPAVMQPTTEPPPAYTATPQPRITTDELQRRQEELERKAAELQRREEELRNVPYNARNNNWPPLPEKCCVQPCFYQDINVDIPLEFQKIVRTVYYLWMFDACVMLLNVIGGLSLLIGVGDGYTFGLSIVFFVVFTPFAYICWFRPIYKAFRSDSSFNFFVFFFVFFINCILKGIFACGIPNMGACGWVVSIQAYSKNLGAGIFTTLVAIAFTVMTTGNVFFLLKIHRIYRNTGASFAKAQQEFASGVLRNEHVQNVASNAAASAVRQSMTSNTATTGSRY